jgi:hypothetical protein
MKNDNSPLSSDFSDSENESKKEALEMLDKYLEDHPEAFQQMQSDEYLMDYFSKRGMKSGEEEDQSNKYGRRKVKANLNEEMNNHWSRQIGNNIILFNSASIKGKSFSPYDIIDKSDNIDIADIKNIIYISKISIPNHTFTACCVIDNQTKKSNTYIIDPNVMPETEQDISQAKEQRIELLNKCKSEFSRFTDKWKIDHNIEIIPIVLNNCGKVGDNCGMYPLEYIRNIEKETRYMKEAGLDQKLIEEKIIGIKSGTLERSISTVEGKKTTIEIPNTKYIRIDRSVEEALLSYIYRMKNKVYEKEVENNLMDTIIDKNSKNSKIKEIAKLDPNVVKDELYKELYLTRYHEKEEKKSSPTKGSPNKGGRKGR